MNKLCISVPCWGEFYRNLFINTVLPAQAMALEIANAPFHYIIHTDEDEEVFKAIRNTFSKKPLYEGISFFPVAKAEKYEAFGKAHQEALFHAEMNSVVVLTDADLIWSMNTLAAAIKLFHSTKKKLILYCVPRILLQDPILRIADFRAHTLAHIAAEHLHPINKELIWGRGRSRTPSSIMFQEGMNLSTNAFHLVPLALVKDRNILFEGTHDDGLVAQFQREDIHVVTHPNEGMVGVELSPERGEELGELLNVDFVSAWAQKHTTPLQRWLFSHTITLRGSAQPNPVVQQILERLK